MLNQKTIQKIPQNCNMIVKVLSFINNDEEDQSQEEIEKKQKVFEILRTSMQLQEVEDQENDYESDYIPVPCEEACFSQQSTQKSQQSQYLRSPLQTFTQHFQNQNKGFVGKLFTLTDETEYTVDDRKPTHTRGPSKIQEILQDLQANVADDIMKMANDIIKFTENSSNTNGSAQFIQSDSKLKPHISQYKANQQPRETKANNLRDGFKLFEKQNSQKQLKSDTQLDKQSLKSNCQNEPQKYIQQLPKTNYQTNANNYNSNNTNYNSHYNTNASVQKNQQKSERNSQEYTKNNSNRNSYSQQIINTRTSQEQINCNSSQNSLQQNSPNQDDQRHQYQFYSKKQNSNNNSNRDSVFSKKKFHINYDSFKINSNNNQISQNFYDTVQKQFNFYQNSDDENQGKQSIENQTPNLNISKKLEKDNLSINNSSTLNLLSDKKSYQEFCEPCQNTQESDKKQNSSIQKKKVKRRKRSRIPKNIKYFLDIIEEQSNDYFTPDKSLLESSECLDTIQSVPNFGESEHDNMSYRSDRKNFTISEGNKIKIRTPNTQEIKEELQSSDSFDRPNSQLINQTLVNFEDIDQILNQVQGYKALRCKNQEEEAILASWNRVCNEIIRKQFTSGDFGSREDIKLTGNLTIKLALNYFNHNQKTDQNSFVENSCFIETDQQHLEKSESEIQGDDNNDAEVGMLNKQFSPNFSDVCKRIQFTGLEEPKILFGKATSSKDLPNVQIYNTKYEQQLLNYQF
ncbi:unnamed protein product (macronuclear) [Paramecium tetraurelia]|uniref:Condensin complex subunit 2 n=1 Tax=Paramecium tetraurelia TaxID=5888 RepID=A0DBD8_PARTE|nr:uncharacterized protein GSPATT00015249001 [Paramecium tetraurelia]CAK80355.1 unnamed protein product [Paramecium tetraurelia]|eukprot:XP_001447752.1 hypothetical protein (macronuclear) [Paramecium tetraurelia strain d4-2]